MDKRKEAHKTLYHESSGIDGMAIKGFDFASHDMKKFIEAYKSTGFQASH